MLLPIIAGFILRVAIAAFTYQYSNYDALSYKLFGQYFLDGKTVYPVLKTNYPYFPVIIYLGAFAVYLTRFGIPHMLMIKLLLACIDTVNIYLVYLLSGKKIKAAYLYALNPIPILVTSLHGQFDALPVMFLLSAYYFHIRKNKESLVMLIGSMAIAVKTWPLLFLIPIVKRLKDKRTALLLFVFPALSVFIYLVLFPKTNIADMFSVIFRYRGAYGIYGIGWLLGLIFQNQYVFKISTAIMLGFVAISILHYKKSILAEVSDLFLLFFALSTGIGIQWFMWCVPFFLIVPSTGTYILLVIISILYAVSYFPGLLPSLSPFISNIDWFALWLAFSFLAYRNVQIKPLGVSVKDFRLRIYKTIGSNMQRQ